MGAYKESHSRKYRVNFAGIVVSAVFLMLFLFASLPFFGVLNRILLGPFGLLVFPVCLFGMLIGVAIATRRKFNRRTKSIILISASVILLVALLHTIFSAHIIRGFGSKITFENYGAYIIDCTTLTEGVTVGGGIFAIFVYPFTVFFGIVGTCIMLAIALVVVIGFTLDYYISMYSSAGAKSREGWQRNMPDSTESFTPAADSITNTLTSMNDSSRVVPLKTSDDEYTRFLKFRSEREASAVSSVNPAKSEAAEKMVAGDSIPQRMDKDGEYAIQKLYGDRTSPKENPTRETNIGITPSEEKKFESLKEYIKNPFLPPVFTKPTEQKSAETEKPKEEKHIRLTDITNIDPADAFERFRRQIGGESSRVKGIETERKDAFEIAEPEEPKFVDNRDLPHQNPYSVEEIGTEEDIFEEDAPRRVDGALRVSPRETKPSRMGDQLFGDRTTKQPESRVRETRETRNLRETSRVQPQMGRDPRGLRSNDIHEEPNNFETQRNGIQRREENLIFDDLIPDDFGRKKSGRGPDLAPRKTPDRRKESFTGFGVDASQNETFAPKASFPNFGISQNPSSEQIELSVGKRSPFSVKGEKDERYITPPTSILVDNSTDPSKYGGDFAPKARAIEAVLDSFRIPVKVVNIIKGPTFSKFELAMPQGIPVKKVLSFSDDIAMALMSKNGVRIEAPIPGKNAVGVEIPNDVRATVGLREILESKEFQSSSAILPVAIGKNIYGETVVASMAKMIHLLVAGSTGSGKSVFLHNLILSLMYKSSPAQLRFIMIDPKRVEFTMYNGMPHLMLPNVVTECDKAINAFSWAVKEMDRRYRMFQANNVNNIESFNASDIAKSGEEKKIPYIVIIVDELADLMMVGKRDVEGKIQRLAQLGRACGIFLVIATQRPSVEVVTGTIKSNLPTRIAFALASFVDSRTILDEAGAEKLLGKGDMLYSPQDASVATRLQAAYVETTDIKKVIDYIKENNEIYFDEEVEKEIMTAKEDENKQQLGDQTKSESEGPDYDEILPQVLKYFIETNSASTSMIQRRFKVGYARAARILDEMEVAGFVSPANGSKARNVYMTMEQFEQMFGDNIEDGGE